MLYTYKVVVPNPMGLPLQHIHPHAQQYIQPILSALIDSGAEKVIVFGSALDYNVYSQDSDIDVAVIARHLLPTGITTSGIGKQVDMLIYTDDSVFEAYEPFSIEDSIMKGVVIYER